MADLTPCILERKILPKVWGGRALESVLGLELPASEDIGETWELYDRPDGSSKIRGSDLTLRDLMLEHSGDLLGRGVRATAAGYFPLLLKYIDAADKLSVQVHPDDVLAQAEGDGGKAEAWVVLHAGAKARIIRGFKPGVSKEDFAKVAHTAEVEELLHAFAPKAGDTIDVPTGTVHAIGPDVVVFEVQQNSDVTYRLYDWGRPRETHVDKALKATRITDDPALAPTQPMEGGGEWLVRNEFFRLRRQELSDPATLGTGGIFKVISVVQGHGSLGWRSGGRHEPLVLRQGDTALVPASTGAVYISPIGRMSILVSDVEGVF